MDIEKYDVKQWKEEELLPGIECAYQYRKGNVLIARIVDPLDSQLADGFLEEDGLGVAKILQLHFDCHYLLLVRHIQEEVQIIAFSDEKRVRAYEFLDYIISDFGLVKGNAHYAYGKVSYIYLGAKLSYFEMTEVMEYLFAKCRDYFENCDWINAEGYGKLHEEEIKQMTCYQKKRIPWAYVKTVDIVPENEKIQLRSLENESGITIQSDKDTYIMIGSRGEIYDINRSKFERTYEATTEALDIFEQMLDFLPEVQLEADGSYVMLDEYAKICYPKTDAKIYARQIERRTKIFPAEEGQEYYLGRAGDYMAVRTDDFDDLYIIQADIFKNTYEEIKQLLQE